MKAYIPFILIACYVLLSACAGTQVYSNQSKGIDYRQFKTYAWLPVVDTSKGSLFYNEIVEQNIVDKVSNEMNQRNYKLDTKDAELLILLHLNFKQEKRQVINTYPLYGAYPYYYDGFSPMFNNPFYYNYYNSIGQIYSSEIDTIQYTSGTVVIDIIRNSDDKLIWRGWSRRRIKPETASRQLEKIVDKIFTHYPVKEIGN